MNVIVGNPLYVTFNSSCSFKRNIPEVSPMVKNVVPTSRDIAMALTVPPETITCPTCAAV